MAKQYQIHAMQEWPLLADRRLYRSHQDTMEKMLKSDLRPVYPPLQEPQILRLIVTAAIRMPKLALAIALLVLMALAGSMTYSGYLVIGVIADFLSTGRIIVGLLLGCLFARIPRICDGKFSTVGLLPKRARRPVMLALLAVSLLSFSYRGELVPMLFLGFAAVFLITYPLMKQAMVSRARSSFFKPAAGPNRPEKPDDNVIDVEFREKKD